MVCELVEVVTQVNEELLLLLQLGVPYLDELQKEGVLKDPQNHLDQMLVA